MKARKELKISLNIIITDKQFIIVINLLQVLVPQASHLYH